MSNELKSYQREAFSEKRQTIENALSVVRPELALEWHPTRNAPLTPNLISYGSTKKVWWICNKGHEFQATVNNRSSGYGCPYCSGRKPYKGETDLVTTNPRLAAEWHPTKNYPLCPEDVSAGSKKKVWWKCNMGHEWLAVIYSRSDGNDCPVCSKRNHSSFPEQAIYFYTKKVFPDAVNGFTELFSNKMELDIFIPSIKVGIEYDGIAWHNSATTSKREKKKYELCQANDIRLIRIKENVKGGDDNQQFSDYIIHICKDPSYKEIDSAIIQLLQMIAPKINININSDADKNEIKAQYMFAVKQRSLAVLYPHLASEWHPTKNKPLTPEAVMPNAHDNVWWQCNRGHEWEAAIYSRVNGNGCPYCSNQKVLAGFNDLVTVNPQLANSWHPTKNLPLTPNMVTAGSNKKVWWICEKGHEWEASINSRRNGVGCPICTNKKVLKGYNDLATVEPSLVEEWHPTKNLPLTPYMFTKSSGEKIWWQCSKGHEWQTRIVNRSRGSGCPICAQECKTTAKGKRTYSNLLSVANPKLSLEWDSAKNLPLSPSTISYGSEKKVWWRCNLGHEWEASVKSRSRGTGCPYCSNRKVLSGYNDLQAVNPILVSEWHPRKNTPLAPNEISPNSNRKVWWLCHCGHEWEASVDNRNKGAGCPICAKCKRKPKP